MSRATALKPTYEELEALILELADIDWYSPNEVVIQKVFAQAERIKSIT